MFRIALLFIAHHLNVLLWDDNTMFCFWGFDQLMSSCVVFRLLGRYMTLIGDLCNKGVLVVVHSEISSWSNFMFKLTWWHSTEMGVCSECLRKKTVGIYAEADPVKITTLAWGNCKRSFSPWRMSLKHGCVWNLPCLSFFSKWCFTPHLLASLI